MVGSTAIDAGITFTYRCPREHKREWVEDPKDASKLILKTTDEACDTEVTMPLKERL